MNIEKALEILAADRIVIETCGQDLKAAMTLEQGREAWDRMRRALYENRKRAEQGGASC
mgnify:CR=1 FL=1